jgi:hypothetical protein
VPVWIVVGLLLLPGVVLREVPGVVHTLGRYRWPTAAVVATAPTAIDVATAPTVAVVATAPTGVVVRAPAA